MDIIDLKSQLENEDNAKKRAELLAQLEYILKKVGKVRILPILLQTHHHKASAVPLLLL